MTQSHFFISCLYTIHFTPKICTFAIFSVPLQHEITITQFSNTALGNSEHFGKYHDPFGRLSGYGYCGAYRQCHCDWWYSHRHDALRLALLEFRFPARWNEWHDSASLWAWREGRVCTIAEPEYRHSIDWSCTYLADTVAVCQSGIDIGALFA